MERIDSQVSRTEKIFNKALHQVVDMNNTSKERIQNNLISNDVDKTGIIYFLRNTRTNHERARLNSTHCRSIFVRGFALNTPVKRYLIYIEIVRMVLTSSLLEERLKTLTTTNSLKFCKVQ